MGIIFWGDIETLGLNFKSDPIVEFGSLITSQKSLTLISRREWIICPPNWPERKEALPDAVRTMHEASGLIADLDALYETDGEIPTLYDVETEIMQFLASHRPGNGRVPLAGAGVANFDIHVIRAQMPRLTEMLSWWTYDVGHVRRLAALSGIRPPADEVSDAIKTHRALDDILMHLEEARWHMSLYREIKKNNIRGVDTSSFTPVDEAAAATEAVVALWMDHVTTSGCKDTPTELKKWLSAQIPSDDLPEEKV